MRFISFFEASPSITTMLFSFSTAKVRLFADIAEQKPEKYPCIEKKHYLYRQHQQNMDKLTKEQRHHCMSAIKSKNTQPELLVRKFLFSRGYRYRLNYPRLPGHPDLVLRKYRTVIFVNGCFWHGHEGCKYYVLPKSNVEFWHNKIEKNRNRDRKKQLQLTAMGWHCITIWECQLKPKVRRQTLEALEYTLNHIYLEDRRLKPYEPIEGESPMAAETMEEYNNGIQRFSED